MIDRVRGRAAALALAVAVGPGAACLATESPPDPRLSVVSGYFEALGARDWEAARAAWRPEDLARAERLGIRYEGLPLKVDGDSELARTAARSGLTGTRSEAPAPHPLAELLAGPPPLALVRVEGAAVGSAPAPHHDYLLVETDAGWRLASPVGLALAACARRSGAVAEGRYVRAVTGPGMEGRAPALAALDSFVEVTLRQLEVPAARCRLLARDKIDYLFVRPDWVEQLAGAPTVGVANLQVDAVVTHHPCHLHELAHILANFRLEELPLFTLPVLQEGLAVHLGGRWERGPGFLAQVGRMFLADGYVALGDLLPRDDFYRLGADLSYPTAGVLAGWLLESAGAARFADTYLALSGTPERLSGLSADQVAAVLGAPLGLPDADVASLGAALASRLVALPGNPLRAAPAGADGEPLRRFTDAGLDLRVWRSEDTWIIEIVAPAGAEPAGALLVSGEAAAPSALFAEHFPDYSGPPVQAALRFTAAEAGWYDYRRDLLVAKHIEAFWPEPAAYEPRTLRLAWPADLVPWDPSGDAVVLRRDAGR